MAGRPKTGQEPFSHDATRLQQTPTRLDTLSATLALSRALFGQENAARILGKSKAFMIGFNDDWAWERFKDLLRACPHHGFMELHQIDTFYNSLTSTDQDSLNAAAGGNLLTKTPKDALTLIENKSKVHTSRNRPVVSKVSTNTSTSGLSPNVVALTDAVKALLLKNTTPPPASVKAVEESYVTCGGPHPYYQWNAGYVLSECSSSVEPSTGFPPFQNNQNQGNNYNPGNSTYRAPTPPTQAAPSNELANYMKVNDTNMRAMQNQITNMKTELKNEFQATMLQQNNKLENMLSNYFQIEQTFGSRGLVLSLAHIPLVHRKGDLKAITSRSVVLRGLYFDSSSILHLNPRCEREPEVTKDSVQPSTEKVQPPDVPIQAPTSEPVNIKPNLPYPSRLNNQKLRERDDHQMMKPTGIAEDVFVRVGKFHFPADFVVVDYVVDPRVPLILERPFLRTARSLIDVYGEELTLRVSDEAITFKVGFSDNSESGNPTPISEPIIAKSSPSLTPFEGGDFILEEIEAYLASDLIPSGIDDAKFDPEGDIRLIEEMLNKDPYSPFPPKDLKSVTSMSKEGMILGHKILKYGIEEDRTKVDVIA
ncbi:reverse transcriptase domain-containing protein [Tanacetum coccineum]